MLAENQYFSKDDMEFVAHNMLLNYCLWDDHAALIDSFFHHCKIDLNIDIQHFHFCITGLDKKYMEHKNPVIFHDDINATLQLYSKIQQVMTKHHYRGISFLIKVDNSKKMAVLFSQTSIPLCSPVELAEQIADIAKGKNSALWKYVYTSLVTDYCGYEAIHQAYLDANALNRLSFFGYQGKVILKDQVDQRALDCGLASIDENCRHLRNALCELNLELILQQVETIFYQLVAPSLNYEYFMAAYTFCETTIQQFKKVFHLNLTYQYKLSDFDTVDEYVNQLKETLQQIHQAYSTHPPITPLILLTLSFIYEHYTKDLSLKSLAEYISTNPTSLSTEFNRVTGSSISETLSRLRVEHACTLLTTTSFAIQDIAKYSGFTNTRYFTSVFHKLTGCSPSLYRKSKQTANMNS